MTSDNLELQAKITEYKLAEQKIRQSEERFRSLVTNSSDIIVLLRKDGTFSYISPSGERLLGYKPDELIDKNAFEFIHHDDLLRVKDSFAEIIQNPNTLLSVEYRFRHKDGSWHVLESTGSNQLDNPAIKCIVVNTRDITERKKVEDALKASESELRTLVAAIPDVIFTLNNQGRYLKIAPTNPSLLYKSAAELIGKTLCEVFPQSQAEFFLSYIKRALDLRQPVTVEYSLQISGSEVWFSGSVAPMTDDTVIWVARDITERKMAEKEMLKLSTAVEQSSDCIFITDREGTIEYVNKAFEKITGYRKEEVIGQNPRMLKSGKHNENFYKEMWDTILSGRSYTNIYTNRNKNGELFEVYQTITPIKDNIGNITHFVAVTSDITKQRLLEERIKYLAYYDALTELPNRTLFMDRLSQSISIAEYEKRLVSVLVIDLDRFKLINDTFGPNLGDIVLKEIARRLLSIVREGDTVARLESDEFGVVLADIASSEDVIRIVEKIMKTITQPVNVNEEQIVLTLSIGISIHPNDGKDAQTLMQNAGMATSKAKELGRNNYQFYASGMNVRASEFISMERNLFAAFKNGEFILRYQPYWETNTKKITGMEALIRWQSKDMGLVPPVKFIPVLEETGMIKEVGEWVLRTAVRQIKKWQNKGLNVVPVSVNLSSVQFRQKELADIVESVIGEFDLNTSLLTLEITESAFMQDIELTRSVLKRLKQIGISISIDDFGTGYSSLSYLKRFPVDNLKIDISFTREIATDPDTASIVTAIIAMAHSLNIKTIAEGVETEEQWKILRLLRNDMVQGFFLSRPLPAEDVEKLLI